MGPSDYGRYGGVNHFHQSIVSGLLTDDASDDPGEFLTGHDDDQPDDDGIPQQAVSRTAETEELLMAEHPGWRIWAVRLFAGNRLVWSARPAGAEAAVITDADSPEDVSGAIRLYEQHLSAHLDVARRNAAGQPDTGIGHDKARALAKLVLALEIMQADQAGAEGS